MTSKTAIIYGRISSMRQKDGLGIQRQLENALRVCEDKGWTITDDSIYTDIASGFHGRHLDGELGVLLDAVEAGQINHEHVIVIESLDRLGREYPITAVKRFMNIIEKTDIYETSTNMLYSSNGTSFSVMVAIAGFVIERAHNESLIKQKRSIANYEIKIKNANESDRFEAIAGRPPLWCDIENGCYVINDKADTVKLIYARYLEGMGIASIVQYLNDNNIPMIEHPQVQRRVHIGRSEWDRSRIETLLTNPSSYGRLVSTVTNTITKAKEVVTRDGIYPPIISQDEFEQCKALRASRNRNKSKGFNKSQNINILSGIAKCANCGGGYEMTATVTGRKTRNPIHTKMLRCGFRAKKGDCKNKSVNLEQLENAIIKHVKHYDFTPNTVDKDALLIRVKDTEDRLNNLQDIFLLDTSNANIKNEYLKTKTLLDDLRLELSTIQSSEINVSDIKLDTPEDRMNAQKNLSLIIDNIKISATKENKQIFINYRNDGNMHMVDLDSNEDTYKTVFLNGEPVSVDVVSIHSS